MIDIYDRPDGRARIRGVKNENEINSFSASVMPNVICCVCTSADRHGHGRKHGKHECNRGRKYS